MKLKYNLVVEFLYLMVRVCNDTLYDKHPIIQHYKKDPEVEALVSAVRKELSPFLRKDLEYFILNFTGSISIPLILSLERGYENPLDVIDAIEAMEASAWLQYYFELNDREERMADLSDDELKALIEDQIRPNWDIPNQDSVSVLELRAYQEESKAQIVRLYRDFYHKHFEALEPMLEEKLEGLVAMHQRVLDEKPEAFLEEILWMKKEAYSDVRQVEFTVTWIGELTHSVSMEDDWIVGIYGFGFLQRFDEDFIRRQTIKLFKVLSDERRLDILRMVGKKPCYATELAKELGLTKATVSYHMSLILEQGLVTLKLDQNRAYYRLNREGLNRQLMDVINDLAGDA
jgi:DNA-binding transcriptional ArsR family regulator